MSFLSSTLIDLHGRKPSADPLSAEEVMFGGDPHALLQRFRDHPIVSMYFRGAITADDCILMLVQALESTQSHFIQQIERFPHSLTIHHAEDRPHDVASEQVARFPYPTGSPLHP